MLFANYKDPSKDEIGGAGIQQFFEDIGVDLSDTVTVAVSFQMGTQN